MENNKKTLILSIVGILVLVIAVIGISFAMYTFTGTGSKENVIQTGTITMSFDPDNNFAVTNEYPMVDSKGIQTTNKATFGVNANWGSAKMTINYDLGLTAITEGTTLTEEHIKVALLDGEGAVLVGNQANGQLTGGVTIASLVNKAGTHGLIKNYALTSGTLTTSGTTDNYTILAYVADTYDLPTGNQNARVPGGTAEPTPSSEIHKNQTVSETFTFKVTLKASQVTGENNQSTTTAVYSRSTDRVHLGASKDSISGYTTDYTTLGINHFLKHNIGSDNTVESQEVCYILNGNQYCLKGGDNDASYKTNKTILLESFGEENCTLNSDSVECSASGLYVDARDYGNVYTSDDTASCYVGSGGNAGCTE